MNALPLPDPSLDPSAVARELEGRTFEDLVTELEKVALAMDRGDIGIEEAANLYTRASALHAAASARLQHVQSRLAVLRGDTGAV
jgi:exodeoxyribonuclease VII small subunit